MPITKHSYIVKDITKLADTIRKAFYIAKSGRPGPVLVDVTKDVTGALYDYKPRRPATVTREISEVRDEDLAAAIELIKNAERPFIFNGGGAVISGAQDEITELAYRIQVLYATALWVGALFPVKIRCIQACWACMVRRRLIWEFPSVTSSLFWEQDSAIV